MLEILTNVNYQGLEGFSDKQHAALKQKSADIDRIEDDIKTIVKPIIESHPSWSEHITPATLLVFQDDNSWNTISTKNSSKIFQKDNHANFDLSDPSSLKSIESSMVFTSSDEESENVSSPSYNPLRASDMKTYGAMPIDEDIVVVKCKVCSKPILASNFEHHQEICEKLVEEASMAETSSNLKFSPISDDESVKSSTPLYKKTKKRRDYDEPDRGHLGKKGRKGSITSINSQTSEEGTPVLPRKQLPNNSDKPDKKKKKEKQVKVKPPPKEKPPLDLDKQCGVITGPNNMPCARSLTCKTHSMGAKRSVVGRSQPYDVLLAAYQKKSIGRPQNSSSSPLLQKANATTNKLRIQKKVLTGASSSTPVPEAEVIDSDEEVETVMEAIKSSCPTPLAEIPRPFMSRRNRCVRLRELLLDAISPKSSLTDNTTPAQTRSTANAGIGQLSGYPLQNNAAMYNIANGMKLSDTSFRLPEGSPTKITLR
ncbi:SCA7, zinc-binding domain-containing protein [Umbelopsis sp. PMI_123]|nr:SCA7, zinc-binding domain-containing protein [Umbelopsis sp. PMI_123]